MPQGGAPAPAGAPPSAAPTGQPPQGGDPQGGPGGGVGEAIVQVDQLLNKLTQAVSQNDQLGDDVKSAFQDALSSFRGAATALVKAAGGDGSQEPDADDQGGGGAVTPEQGGAGGAVPMSHQNLRGG